MLPANRCSQVKYIYRRNPTSSSPGPGYIKLCDGDEIKFGAGLDGETIGTPLPSFCNLQLAIGRVLRASGTAEVIAQMKYDADAYHVSKDCLRFLSVIEDNCCGR
jgi:hypothetical protein